MDHITITERELTDTEYADILKGFDEHTIEHGNPVETTERITFIVTSDDKFIGCSSGLAYKNDSGYSKWFFLSDLFIDRSYRNKGIGAAVLKKLEDKAAALGIKKIWTWTAGYEGSGFYRKMGYIIFAEQAGFYTSGHSRFGFVKNIGQ